MPDTTAPDRIYINGALAYAKGDPVPADAAKALGLSGRKKDAGPIWATADENGVVSGTATTEPVS